MYHNLFKHIILFQSLDKLLKYLIFILISLCTTTYSSSSTNDLNESKSFGIYMIKSPESTVAPKGDEVLFECQLNLIPDKIKWRFRHFDSKWDFNGFVYLESFNISTEDATSKLRVLVAPKTLGEYQCVAWFGSSAISSIPSVLTLASISLNKNNTRLTEPVLQWHIPPKNSVLIKCGEVISNPLPVWSFYKNIVSIPQIDQAKEQGVLVINNVTPKDSGVYSCSAMNSITGDEIQLPQKIELKIDHTIRKAPHFLIQPIKKISVNLGQTILLECPGIAQPPPKPVWSSPDIRDNMTNNRTTIFPYGLQIVNVSPSDNGTYTCRLDNGIAPVLVHNIKLEVLEKPVILKGPQATLSNESESLQLECIAKGTPKPDIYWTINSIDTRNDKDIMHQGSNLIIPHVKKSHAGVVQCFAKNSVGETNENNLLQVNPKQIDGETGNTPLGFVPKKPAFGHDKIGKGRRKHKLANMIPPSRPNITRLSDDSVMLRWFVPINDGLPIQFFKVQFRMLGDITKIIPRENWQTTNDDIPYGNHDKNPEDIKNFTSSVSGLKPDRFYRFRIIAVYSNNDNKEGDSSGKFLLLRGSTLGPIKGNLPSPILSKVQGASENAIILHWNLPLTNRTKSIDGFYAHYRSASSAGEYMKATIDGMHTRHFKIGNLESNTAYEFKLQSFTASAASDFSAILTGKTLKPPTPTPSIVPPTTSTSKTTQSFYPVIYGAIGGGVVLLIVVLTSCFCLQKRKTLQRIDEDKPHIDRIQADEHIISHHKPAHRLNGVMNITSNPLSHEGDKNHRNIPSPSPTPAPIPPHLNHQSQNKNHQYSQQIQPNSLLSYHHSYSIPQLQSSSPKTPTMLHKHLHHQNNNHHYISHHNQSVIPSLTITNGLPVTPNLDYHKRTLERSNRNLQHYSPPPPILNRSQRSPMPRFKNRNHSVNRTTENLSSGSLNSIEV